MPATVAATTARPRMVWRMPMTLAGTGVRAVIRWMATTPATATAPGATAGSMATAAMATARAARVGDDQLSRRPGPLVKPGDLGADVGDGGGGAAGEDQPGGDGFGRRVPGSEEDHGGNRADAVGAGELGDEPSAARAGVEPQLGGDERRRDRRGPPERRRGGDRCSGDEGDDDRDLDEQDPAGEPGAVEVTVAVPVDEHDAKRGAGQERDDRGGPEAQPSDAGGDGEPEHDGLRGETPTAVLGRDRDAAQR